MLRVEVREGDREALPPIDLADASFVIGSAPTARVRLPAIAAQAEHVRIEGGRWRDLVAGTDGEIGELVIIELGTFRVRITPAPPDAVVSPPQRTESLARELLRGLLGGDAVPTLEIERGPGVGAKRKLAPPESSLIIGRGDEASWILVDEDLSRTHAEIRRAWDGTRVLDLYSKNGTRVDGVVVGPGGTVLRDGALVELGKVALRFRDPADRQLAEESTEPAVRPTATITAMPSSRERKLESVALPAPPAPDAPEPPEPKRSAAPFYIAVTIMFAALAGLVWVLAACSSASKPVAAADIVVLDPAPMDALVLDVRAVRWTCEIKHADDVVTDELRVPVGRAIKLHVWTPEAPESARGLEVSLVGTSAKKPVVQHKPVEITFRIDKPGIYEWKCPTLTGRPEDNPIKTLLAIPAAEYDAFLASHDTATMDPVELGKKLYEKKGCQACHTIDGSPRVGPSWKGIWGTKVVSSDGTERIVDEAFVEESVKTPQAFVLRNFPPSMPSFEGQLKPVEIAALIAFIKSLGN